MSIESYGWDPDWQAALDALEHPDWFPGRVTLLLRDQYSLVAPTGDVTALLAGKVRHNALTPEDLPAVGDWVAVAGDPGDMCVIQALLPRRTKFSRRASGTRAEEQLIAANINTVFLVMGLDNDWNARRLERYLGVAWQSGATPVVLLTKADLAEDLEARLAATQEIAQAATVHAISVHEDAGLEQLDGYLRAGTTIALLGSSGVGKSTLVNHLLGDARQKIQSVRIEDSRGRHTTTHREIFQLPSGALIIDTPGMRELQMWDAGEGVGIAFADIEALATQCQFRDCQHQSEPGCAVEGAVESGELESKRLESYRKLLKELEFSAARVDPEIQAARKAKWKKLSAKYRKMPHRDR